MIGNRDQLADFAPLAERALSVEPASMIRFRAQDDLVAGFVRLPYDVLAGRTLRSVVAAPFDQTVAAADFLRWLDDQALEPAGKDAHWLSALPPRTGWRRVETVPDTVVRDLVRQGAALAQTAATRPSQQALLESVVLRVSAGQEQVEVPLSVLSALTRMGFLPRQGQAAVDTAPGWLRVAAPLGSTFLSTGQNTLGMLGLL